jgi:CubicO group peptidase (beta-lactamase class C family)
MIRPPRKSLLSLLSLILALSALLALPAEPNPAGAQSQPPAASGPDPRIGRVENGLLPPVLIKGQKTWKILDRMKFYNVPGVSVAVFFGDKVQWAKGYGVMDAETKEPVTGKTLFVAGSISKPVAVMGALRLVQEGKLALDANINSFLTSWKVPENALTAKQPVTLRRIVSHTAGLTVHGFRGYASGEPVPTLIDILNGASPANSGPIVVDIEPGSKWRYSGGGLTVMQLALMDVEKKPFPDILREKVLGPIGMTDSSYEQAMAPARLKLAASGHDAGGKVIQGKRFIYPEMAAAGLWTTPTDLAKFAIEVGRAARGESDKVLGKETAKLMITPQAVIQGTTEMALGLFLERHGAEVYFGHGGQDVGFIASLLADRDGGYGVAIMTNSDGRAGPLINEIMMSVAKEYGWTGYLPAPHDVISLDAKALAAFPGRYMVDSNRTLTVSLEGGRLMGKETGEPVFELMPISAAEFIRLEAPVTYTFADGKGAPSGGVALKSSRGTRTAPRAAEGFKAPADWLEAGDTARAIEGYRALWKKDPKDPNVAEGRLNSAGYSLLEDKKTAEAIALFKLNVELYPDSWNAYDSLGEAYMKNGEKALAVENYEKSLAINPKNAGAVKKLEELRKK